MPTIDQITGTTEPNKLNEASLMPLDPAKTVGVLNLDTDFGVIRVCINQTLAEELVDVLSQFISAHTELN